MHLPQHVHPQQQMHILHFRNRLMAKIAELETKLYEKELAGSDLIPAVHCECSALLQWGDAAGRLQGNMYTSCGLMSYLSDVA